MFIKERNDEFNYRVEERLALLGWLDPHSRPSREYMGYVHTEVAKSMAVILKDEFYCLQFLEIKAA